MLQITSGLLICINRTYRQEGSDKFHTCTNSHYSKFFMGSGHSSWAQGPNLVFLLKSRHKVVLLWSCSYQKTGPETYVGKSSLSVQNSI